MATPSEPFIQVVILNWSRRDDTLACLATLREMDYGNFGTVVVDNGSKDDSVQAIRRDYPEVEVIENGSNLGFAGGNNVGIRFGLDKGADYVLLLNNDTKTDRGLLRELVRVAESDPKIGSVGPKVLHYDDPERIWALYGRITFGRYVVAIEGRDRKDDQDGVAPVDVDFVAGCGLMLSDAAIREVGLLDESFFAYHEDVDWAIRARRKGFRNVFVPSAILMHRGASTANPDRIAHSPAAYLLMRNSVLLVKKHGTWHERGRFLKDLFLHEVVHWPVLVYNSRFYRRATWLKMRALCNGFLGKAPPLTSLNLR